MSCLHAMEFTHYSTSLVQLYIHTYMHTYRTYSHPRILFCEYFCIAHTEDWRVGGYSIGGLCECLNERLVFFFIVTKCLILCSFYFFLWLMLLYFNVNLMFWFGSFKDDAWRRSPFFVAIFCTTEAFWEEECGFAETKHLIVLQCPPYRLSKMSLRECGGYRLKCVSSQRVK